MRIAPGGARVVLEVALSISAAVGVATVLLAAAALIMGIRPVVFLSGSMAPAVPTGSLALTIDTAAHELAVGDVVTVEREKTLVTHRIVDVERAAGDSAMLILKGDANPVPDAKPDVVERVGRVFWSTPGLGSALSAFTQPAAVFACGTGVGIVAAIGFQRRDSGPSARRRRLRSPAERARRGSAAAGSGAVALAALAASGAFHPVGTQASWTDVATARAASSSATVEPVENLDCTVVGTIDRRLLLTWSTPTTGAEPEFYRITTSPRIAQVTDVAHPGTSASIDPRLLALGTTVISVTTFSESSWHSSAASVSATVTTLGMSC